MIASIKQVYNRLADIHTILNHTFNQGAIFTFYDNKHYAIYHADNFNPQEDSKWQPKRMLRFFFAIHVPYYTVQ